MILATRNAHKVREFERLLPGLRFDPLPDGLESPEETGDTYAENALIKARSAAAHTGRAAFGYDPLFVPVEHPGTTMAALSDDEKDAISHRGKAARELLAWLALRTG